MQWRRTGNSEVHAMMPWCHDAMPVGGFLSVLKISQRKHDSMLFLHVEHEDDLCPCVWYLRSFDGFQAAFCQMSWFSCRENIVSWCQFSWCSGLWCDFSCLMIFPQFSVVVTCERPIGPTTINGFRQRSRRQWTSMNGTEMEMGKYGKCAWQEVSDCLRSECSEHISGRSYESYEFHMSHRSQWWNHNCHQAIHPDGQLSITWEDGSQSDVPADYVRTLHFEDCHTLCAN